MSQKAFEKHGMNPEQARTTTTIENQAFQAVARELERERQRCKELEIEVMALRSEVERLRKEQDRCPAA